jgi:hypothetical protein
MKGNLIDDCDFFKGHVFYKGGHCDYSPGLAMSLQVRTHIYDFIRPWANCHMGNAVTALSKVKSKVTYLLIQRSY